MKTRIALGAVVLLAVHGLEGVTQSAPQEVTGLWYAKLRFGPDVKGHLVLDQVNGGLAGGHRRTISIRSPARGLHQFRAAG